MAAEDAELSAEYLTVRLRAGDTSLDWSGQLDSFPDSRQVPPDLSPGGSAREEEDEDEGLSGQSVSPEASSEAPQGKAKSSLTSIASSLWKPWSYLTGSEAEATTKSSAVTEMTATDGRTTATPGSGKDERKVFLFLIFTVAEDFWRIGERNGCDTTKMTDLENCFWKERCVLSRFGWYININICSDAK